MEGFMEKGVWWYQFLNNQIMRSSLLPCLFFSLFRVVICEICCTPRALKERIVLKCNACAFIFIWKTLSHFYILHLAKIIALPHHVFLQILKMCCKCVKRKNSSSPSSRGASSHHHSQRDAALLGFHSEYASLNDMLFDENAVGRKPVSGSGASQSTDGENSVSSFRGFFSDLLSEDDTNTSSRGRSSSTKLKTPEMEEIDRRLGEPLLWWRSLFYCVMECKRLWGLYISHCVKVIVFFGFVSWEIMSERLEKDKSKNWRVHTGILLMYTWHRKSHWGLVTIRKNAKVAKVSIYTILAFLKNNKSRSIQSIYLFL